MTLTGVLIQKSCNQIAFSIFGKGRRSFRKRRQSGYFDATEREKEKNLLLLQDSLNSVRNL